MTVSDQRLKIATAEKFELKIHEVNPEDIDPLGDRYIVEEVTIDEKIKLGSLLIVTQQPQINPMDPMAPPQVEQRGVRAGIIVSCGNGHLLGLSDHAVMAYEHIRDDEGNETEMPQLIRPWSSVPMFFEPGDVVFFDYNARGRALAIVGREVRVINQIDILASIPKMKMQRGENGWEIAKESA
jgi:co-chaperonin GroES (HSP10)